VLGEAGLAARDARPRPRQTEARRRHRAGGQPGAGQGERRPWPTPQSRGRAGPRQDALDVAGMVLAQPPLAPMTRVGQRTAASRGAKWSGYDAVRQTEPQDHRAAPEGRAFANAGVLPRGDRVRVGRRRWGIATGRVRTGCRCSGGVYGCVRDHPPGTPARILRSMTRTRPPTAGGDCRLRLQAAPISERLPLDEPRGCGQADVGVLAFLEGVNGAADRSEGGLMLARHGSRLNRCASAAQDSAYGNRRRGGTVTVPSARCANQALP
jgi:hypothetical protein